MNQTPICANCAHFTSDEDCARSEHTEPVRGFVVFNQCLLERNINGHCGPQGRYFTPRQPEPIDEAYTPYPEESDSKRLLEASYRISLLKQEIEDLKRRLNTKAEL